MIVCVHAYRGASEGVKRHFPYYAPEGATLVGLLPDGDSSFWPKPIPTFNAGRDAYIEPSDRCNLPEKLIRSFEWMLENYPSEDTYFVMEWDAVILQPPPQHTGGFLVNVYGPCAPSWNVGAKCFFHQPWWADHDTAVLIAKHGREFIRNNDCENGSTDVFLGWLCEARHIPYGQAPGLTWSSNGLDGGQLEGAKKAVANGAWFVHGLKDPGDIGALVEARDKWKHSTN